MGLIEEAIRVAQSQHGVVEVGGNNRGPQVEVYQRLCGGNPGDSWCAAFLCWCIKTAADDLDIPCPVPLTEGCEVLRAWGKARDLIFDTPAVGDAFLRVGYVNGVYRAHHTGFVGNLTPGGGFFSVEGNSNEAGSPDGYEVAENHRVNMTGLVFLRWGAAAEAADTWELFGTDGHDLWSLPVIGGTAYCDIHRWAGLLGFAAVWDGDSQTFTLDGTEVVSERKVIEGSSFYPLRDLADQAGLGLNRNATAKHVMLVKPERIGG